VLLRFGNAAVPVVDVGTDVLVFSDALDLSTRVQVKTAKLVDDADGGQSAQFNLPFDQLVTDDVPPLYYALVTRDAAGNSFPDFIILSREDARRYHLGTVAFGYPDRANNALKLKLKVSPGVRRIVWSRQVELTRHREDWHALPPLRPPPAQAAASADGIE
jgi:hypothetical protein